MDKINLLYRPNYLLSKDQKHKIIHDINITNLVRMKLILIIFMIVEILFILFNDIPNITNLASNIVWNDSRYFILHLLLLFVSIIGFILTNIIAKNKQHKSENINKLLIPALTIILLSIMAVINGLDQAAHENVSSVFIANLLIFSAVILMRFPLNLVVYSISFLTYLGGLVVFSHNINSLISNSINGLIFFFAVILISTIIYNYHYELISKNLALEETISKLNFMSSHDPLTGLLNRRSFEKQVAEKMNINPEAKRTAALILIDVDYFKHINDKYGHPIGDMVLKEVSQILMKHTKNNDLATRWGGEEFLVFLFQASIDEAYTFAENIRLAIQNNVILIEKFQINITASFGISLFKENFSNSFYNAYKAADTALYQAKNNGRNEVIIAALTAEE